MKQSRVLFVVFFLLFSVVRYAAQVISGKDMASLIGEDCG